jgi:glutamate racemase
MKKEQKKIGIFDSGFGGLHVLRSIVKKLPQYEYVYLGDTARAPYGDRSQEIILSYTRQGTEFLFEQGCGIIIIACNTASSRALRKLQAEYGAEKKVLGVLIPAAEEAIVTTRNQRIGVMATRSTVTSKTFVRELVKLNPSVQVFQKACPLLVPLVEAGEYNSKEMKTILMRYLDPLLRKNIDTLILGCTHYGILERKIRAIIGPHIRIVSETKIVPMKLENYFKRHSEIKEMLSTNSGIRFFSTDPTEKFRILGSELFGRPILVEKVESSQIQAR